MACREVRRPEYPSTLNELHLPGRRGGLEQLGKESEREVHESRVRSHRGSCSTSRARLEACRTQHRMGTSAPNIPKAGAGVLYEIESARGASRGRSRSVERCSKNCARSGPGDRTPRNSCAAATGTLRVHIGIEGTSGRPIGMQPGPRQAACTRCEDEQRSTDGHEIVAQAQRRQVRARSSPFAREVCFFFLVEANASQIGVRLERDRAAGACARARPCGGLSRISSGGPRPQRKKKKKHRGRASCNDQNGTGTAHHARERLAPLGSPRGLHRWLATCAPRSGSPRARRSCSLEVDDAIAAGGAFFFF